VRERFLAIIGSEIHLQELKALRQGLFADILPPMQRDEKRLWSKNLVTFERHREEILARLNNPFCVSVVLNEVLRCRSNRQRMPIIMHAARGRRF
jgi:hypothetical protein